MKKPELMITAGTMEQLQAYVLAGADAVLIGEHRFGLRLPGEFDPHQITDAVKWSHEHGAKVYVAVNQIFDNELIKLLPAYLRLLEHAKVDAIVFGDPAVIIANRQLAQPISLHWSGEMTSTNVGTANFWAQQGAKRVILARELNLEEIQDLINHAQLEVQVQVHGMTNIYHSKRHLIQSYVQHLIHKQNSSLYGDSDKRMDTFDFSNQDLVLIERERPDQEYPYFEDQSGTHMMSSEDICMLENIPELISLDADSWKIEGFMKSLNYNETVVRSYRAALDVYFENPNQFQFQTVWLSAIHELQDPRRELSYGFFYKEQVY